MDDTLGKITVTFAKWCYFKRQCYSSSEHSAKISNIFTGKKKRRLMYAQLNFIRSTRWHKMMLFISFRVVELLPSFKEINLDSGCWCWKLIHQAVMTEKNTWQFIDLSGLLHPDDFNETWSPVYILCMKPFLI